MTTLAYSATRSRSTHRHLAAFPRPPWRLGSEGLEARLAADEAEGVRVSPYDQDKRWTVLRQTNPEFTLSPAACQRSALSRFDKAFRSFEAVSAPR